MRIIPAIDIIDGQCVRLTKGDYNTKKIYNENPLEVDEERAIALIKERGGEKASRVISEFKEAGIKVLKGRYGPYITDGSKNAKIPKDKDPAELTEAECVELLKAPKTSRFAKKGKGKKK